MTDSFLIWIIDEKKKPDKFMFFILQKLKIKSLTKIE